MNLPKACIFDLDGVIVDTVPAHYIAWKMVANELDITFTEEDNEQLKGVSRQESMRRILKIGNVELPDEEVQDLVARKNERYVEIISKMTPEDILPGVKECIALLEENQIKIAIGSSSRNTPIILKAVGLDKVFPVVVDGNKITHSKPHPEVFLKGAEQLGVNPKDTVVFEDAYSGVEAAHRGGMKCIGVGEEEVLGDADAVLPDLQNFDLKIFNSL